MTASTTTRLPMPNWTREGETWRVEPETAVEWTIEVYGTCNDKCERRSVAGIIRRGYLLKEWCGQHLAESKMWVEDGQVVSWTLRP
jgi:hypothetical protein